MLLTSTTNDTKTSYRYHNKISSCNTFRDNSRISYRKTDVLAKKTDNSKYTDVRVSALKLLVMLLLMGVS